MNNFSSNLFFSIILINYNSSAILYQCLEHLWEQTYKNFELIIIDNGSKDPPSPSLLERWPNLQIRIEYLKENKGFAFANNYGARIAKGEWIATLNPDAFPEPNWLEQLVQATSQYPNAFFASRQLQAQFPHLLDGEGDTYHVSGLAWRRNYGAPVMPKNQPEEVFSACAAAALYPRKTFLEVGGFDESYFAYHEDIDLGFRLRLRGLKCYHIPQAVVHHIGSASTGKSSPFAIYHGHRNLVWTFFKNMPPPLFMIYLPLHLLLNFYSLFYFTKKGHRNTIIKAKKDALRGLRIILEKRKIIQRERIASTWEIYELMDKGLFSPITKKIS